MKLGFIKKIKRWSTKWVFILGPFLILLIAGTMLFGTNQNNGEIKTTEEKNEADKIIANDAHSTEYRRKHHICTKLNINEKYLYGEWKLPVITADAKPTINLYPGIFTLNEDHTFTLKGYITPIADPNYTTSGRWSFDKDTMKLKLEFTEEPDFWNYEISRYYDAVFKYDPKDVNELVEMSTSNNANPYPYYAPKVELDGFSPQDSCYITFSIGWTFTHIVKAQDVLSPEEWEDYKKIMDIK